MQCNEFIDYLTIFSRSQHNCSFFFSRRNAEWLRLIAGEISQILSRDRVLINRVQITINSPGLAGSRREGFFARPNRDALSAQRDLLRRSRLRHCFLGGRASERDNARSRSLRAHGVRENYNPRGELIRTMSKRWRRYDVREPVLESAEGKGFHFSDITSRVFARVMARRCTLVRNVARARANILSRSRTTL